MAEMKKPFNENERIEDKIEGRNPVLEALKADTEIDKVYVMNHFKDPILYQIVKLANQKKIPVSRVEKGKLDLLFAVRCVPHRRRGYL